MLEADPVQIKKLESTPWISEHAVKNARNNTFMSSSSSGQVWEIIECNQAVHRFTYEWFDVLNNT